MKAFARKIGTTHYYNDKSKHVVVTLLKLEKSIVGRVKSEEKDGYAAAVVVLDSEKAKVRKSVKNQFKDVNPKYITETELSESVEAGTEFSIKDLKEQDLIIVRGVTKGKGFQGTVKRHGFNTGPKTHGSNNYRRPGSIGVTDPSRVVKGKKMSGHMGAVNRTMKKVKIERIDEVNNVIWVKGHILGPSKAIITISK
jgi:large subunit ribosomal protein L3